MDRIERLKKLIPKLKDNKKIQPLKIESLEWELKFLESEKKQLTLTDVVNCVYVVTERDNYGDQTFKGVFKNKEQALKFLAKDGLTESNIDEINEIELE